ncbi:hypothetical protein [Novispirillum itersonii]|uniref:hypothetical protein n=1 Tax=Novispirillum itersonii TaxID=189 RepID=UPI00037C85D5|nr:hypothetical protein [Novispirillum itersonii]
MQTVPVAASTPGLPPPHGQAVILRPHSSRRPDPWRSGEPSLTDVMTDPLVHLVMRRDGLRSDQVWPVIRQAQSDLKRGARLNG